MVNGRKTQSFLSSENFVVFVIMSSNSRHTTRQRMFVLQPGQELSAHGLAEQLDIPVRKVEDHLIHLVKTVRRHPIKNSSWFLRNARLQVCVWAEKTPHSAKSMPSVPQRIHFPTSLSNSWKSLTIASHPSLPNHYEGCYHNMRVNLLTIKNPYLKGTVE